MNQNVLPAAQFEYSGQAAATAASMGSKGGLHLSPKRRLDLGIAAKIALWTSGIGFGAIATLTIYMYAGSIETIRAREQAAMSSALDAADVRLNAQLGAARDDVRFLAKTPPVAGIGRAEASGGLDPAEGTSKVQWEASLGALFSAMLASRPQYAEFRYISVMDGRSIVRVNRTAGGEIRRMSVEQVPTADDRMLVEAVGKLSEGAVDTSDIVLTPDGGAADGLLRPIVRMATPTFSSQGTLLGVAMVSLDMSQTFKTVEQFAGSLRYLANQDGDYLENPDAAKDYGSESGRRHRLQDDFPPLAGLFTGDVTSYSGNARLGSAVYLAAAKRISFDPRLPGRFLVVAELRSEAALLADITSLRNRSVIAAAGLLVAGFAAVIWLARLIVRPLRQMTELATRVADGDRTIDLGNLTHRRDETGELARAFDVMFREINAREIELAQQAAELQRSNRELSHFAYVASHDLQEPLRMVASYLELLRRRYQGKLDAEADEFIGYAIDGATRMKALINDVLGYARGSNAPLALQPVELAMIVGRVTGLLAGRIADNGAEISAVALPQVQADPAAMERLLANLLENALKYRSESPPRIELAGVRAGDGWEISVTDNGIGIAPEFREKVFDIFTRLHGRDKYEGTGIGLAACRRIIERHGGRIWVEAAPGGGSVVRFTLPAVPAGGGESAGG